jgi:hypothetical protein
MTPQQVILANINSGKYSNLVLAMLIIAYYALGGITEAEVISDLALISWTWDATAYTVSDGTTTYTINTLISTCISTAYSTIVSLGEFTMKTVISQSQTKNWITSDEATSLKAALTA